MNVKCQASKDACDDLVRDFIRLNEQMRLSIQSRQTRTPSQSQ
jgi:hypothetical protein